MRLLKKQTAENAVIDHVAIAFQIDIGKSRPTTLRWRVEGAYSLMKSIFVLGAVALSMTISGVALAADAPAAAPVVVDPITGTLTQILTPIGTVVGEVAQPVIVTPVNAVTAVIAPPPPPAPAAAPAVHHRHHHRHHHHPA